MGRRGAVGAGAVGVAALLLAGGASPALAGAIATKPVVLTLRDAVKTVVARSPEMKSTAFDGEALLGKKQQADGARFPQITSLGTIGPSLEAERQDPSGLPKVLKSLNTREGNLTSAFGSADILLIQPIYTFGLISDLRAAADHGVKARQAGVEKTATEVALRVREAYYGLLLFKDLIGGLHEQLLKAANRQEILLEGGFAAEQDLFKLRTFQGELEKNLNLANRGLAIAKEALRTWIGLDPDADVDTADERLTADLKNFPAVEVYIQETRRKRPEFVQLREGIRAKKALLEAERAKYWPTIFLGVQGSFAYAPNRDRILNNAFVSDPLRHAYVGPILGLKYDVDFGVSAGKIREAEVGKLESKWVITALANSDLGIGETKDLADAVLAMAKIRAEYFQAVFSYQMGIARLDNAAGRDVEEIRALVAEEKESPNVEVTR